MKKKNPDWTAKEKREAGRIMQKAPSQLHLTVYWLSIIVMVVLTLVVAVWLIPFLMFLDGFAVFLLLFLLGLSFGAMFQNLVFHIDAIEHGHYLVAGLIVPVVAVASLFLMVQAANYASAVMQLPTHQNPLEVSLFYLMGFLIPYVYGLFHHK